MRACWVTHAAVGLGEQPASQDAAARVRDEEEHVVAAEEHGLHREDEWRPHCPLLEGPRRSRQLQAPESRQAGERALTTGDAARHAAGGIGAVAQCMGSGQVVAPAGPPRVGTVERMRRASALLLATTLLAIAVAGVADPQGFRPSETCSAF